MHFTKSRKYFGSKLDATFSVQHKTLVFLKYPKPSATYIIYPVATKCYKSKWQINTLYAIGETFLKPDLIIGLVLLEMFLASSKLDWIPLSSFSTFISLEEVLFDFPPAI